ncbi:MAG: pyruvate phosphate dikinase PEP/pyruvate-binding protein [Bacteroidetes bacterium]|nr:MAG: pyruvate phosphate dikinase PEP/pyruvate-binding protein [Bacteroidota bacterium]
MPDMTDNTDKSPDIRKLMHEQGERLKELAAINQTTQILREGKPIDETLQQLAMIFPEAWQYPAFTSARIKFGAKEYKSVGFQESRWLQRQHFETINERKGAIEIFYTKEFIAEDEGPFLKEERHLINNLANMITGYLNSQEAKELLRKTHPKWAAEDKKKEKEVQPTSSKQLLQRFLNKNNYDRDVYHDLMPFKVKEILLVANLYDAYSIEKEGRFSEHVLGEYHQLSLTSLPRITGVSSEEEIFAQLQSKHFDFIIFMVGVEKNLPLAISSRIKAEFPYIPIFLLLNNNKDISFFMENKLMRNVDRIFVWNGESKVFFAMIKHIEDKINVDNDTKVGLVRVILLVEDSPQYYSRYLPLLYSIVLEQTRRIIEDVSTDELYKVLRMRARPKILLASSIEEAKEILNKFRDNMLCLISDVKFDKNGKAYSQAGFELVKYARELIGELPTIIQSHDPENARMAYQLKTTFIDKNSETLVQDFKSFITHYLGFGNFIYRDNEGSQIAVARSLKEFESLLRTIPDESLIYHARKDHFSLWLMARGEIQVAKIINPAKVTDFDSPSKLRAYLIEVIQQFRNEQNRGKVIPFEESAILDESNVVSLSSGSLGGKGRGLAFINTLINNFDFEQLLPNIRIRTPKTSIIGTDEFEYFIERNKLHDKVVNSLDYEEIKILFMNASLTETLVKRLRILLKHITNPIAIRSSGLFEDSLMQPFAGIFETYLLPNNDPDFNTRLQQTMDAIKLVYASVYSKIARGYIEAIHYKIEEEKMAVIIQEVVGNRFENVYYPHISGVAQSYNYYPFAHMKPEEGFAVAALGLGKQVVEGEKAYRFSPKYPSTEINSPQDQFKNSQVDFFAVDLNKKEINLLEGDTAGLIKLEIEDAERHGNLRHMASVYDYENHRIVPGLTQPGPRIINFSNILKYNYIPLAGAIDVVLDVVKEAMGAPVEIEFAVDLNRDEHLRASFYVLQIKPLIGSMQDYSFDAESIDPGSVLLLSEKGMGNGLINDITDVIYIDISAFDKRKTEEMVGEIELLNRKMMHENRKYLLIGPGRWGTRDKWIGIPVNWPQISSARVIVETSLEGYPLDASSGSHFFHNVTSMNVGYFSVQQELSGSFIKWEILDQQPLVQRTTYFKHVRFEKPISIRMDGKKRIAAITWEKKD